MRKGRACSWSIRPAEEYRAGHIPGAISILVGGLTARLKEARLKEARLKEARLKEARLKEVPKNCEVVAYCRGPHCVMAIDAVALLRENGFKAHRLEHGVTDWRARGWRIDSEAAHPMIVERPVTAKTVTPRLALERRESRRAE